VTFKQFAGLLVATVMLVALTESGYTAEIAVALAFLFLFAIIGLYGPQLVTSLLAVLGQGPGTGTGTANPIKKLPSGVGLA